MSLKPDTAELQSAIEAVWEERQGVNQGTTGVVRDTVEAALDLLDKGEVRVAERTPAGWTVNQWQIGRASCRERV
jgi:2,3,4,5-tetrahydropyridine-2-carboxylate N-succinyltransferase